MELPKVVLVTATSVDGRITLGRSRRLLDPDVGRSWATIEVPHAFAHRDRELGATVVLEGSGSFVHPDAPAPDWPPGDPAPPADHLPRRAASWFVVADSRGRVDWRFTGDENTALHVLVCESTPPGYLQRLRDLGVGYFLVGRDRVDLRVALARIRSELGAGVVALNAGGTLNAAMLREGLVDELDVVTWPGLVGGGGAPTMMDGPELGPEELPLRLELLSVESQGDAVRTRYRVIKHLPAGT